MEDEQKKQVMPYKYGMKPTWKSQCGHVSLYKGDCRNILTNSNLSEMAGTVTDFPYCVVRYGERNFQVHIYPSDTEIVSNVLEILETASPESPIVTFASPDFRFPGKWDSVARWYDRGGQADFHEYHEILSARCCIQGVFLDKDETEYHPYQKPLPLVKRLVHEMPTTGYVLDPFMGSGTTGVACVSLNRRFVGIEKDGNRFDIAVARIEEAIKEDF